MVEKVTLKEEIEIPKAFKANDLTQTVNNDSKKTQKVTQTDNVSKKTQRCLSSAI